jgi:hypothetical protein
MQALFCCGCSRPVLARSGCCRTSAIWPLLGAKRTLIERQLTSLLHTPVLVPRIFHHPSRTDFRPEHVAGRVSGNTLRSARQIGGVLDGVGDQGGH